MKIKNVSCKQFAGVRDQNVSFKDGINVIYGKNESGKSTLVNLVSRTFFQDPKLDRRKDKSFYDLYFPSAKKGSTVVGDFADGAVTFETEKGSYTLSKEWGDDPRCSLSTPDGVIRDRGKIDELLKELLFYGEGVYSEMLFSSQYNTDTALQTVLDASKKTESKQELTDALSQAFAESGGASLDSIEMGIAEKIEEIAGKHWDFDRCAPVRKSGRWTNGLGEILKAYYALEDARFVLSEISALEGEADRTSSSYADKDAAVQTSEKLYDRFNGFASVLAVQSERRKSADRLEKELSRIGDVLAVWPMLTESLDKAKSLQIERSNRALIDKFTAAKVKSAELDELKKQLPSSHPTDEETALVRSAQRTVTVLENKLCGMNLNAVVKMLGENSIEIVSLRTGENVDISQGSAPLTEAVRITIPDVMEMQLSPADVDTDAINAGISEQKK